ncbi:MAG: MFS transporter [Phenylobacterium sp.]|uniref:MFS transporter n=1 Tax=Phenylobacterium sp. TaxID=1871053 RepID=UPI0025DC853C|nr:MFS transporter [Phenylobacterium sp.]MBI1200760.1 MFS transporter [Phenylobacterium sp.]
MTRLRHRLRDVPRGVWALGFVSMFMDLSSEMVHALLPAFLVGTLGASVAVLGLIEGVAEATASITKVFSGWISDRLGRRKLLAVIGYGLAAATKPVFPLAVTPLEVLGARFLDRIGKGVRGAPRDALVADITPASVRGLAYGVRQGLDTVGAFLGPLAAILLMLALSDNIRHVLAWAVIPALAAVALLAFGVDDVRPRASGAARAPIRWSELGGLGPAFWAVVLVGAVFSLARFSEAFLILRAQDVGLPVAFAPLVLVVMNVVYSVVAAPAGSLSDRVDRRVPLLAGLVALVAADTVLAFASGVGGVFAAVALWGLHMGLSQGVLSALVADAAPERLRGTAFGLFNLASGVALLAASTVAGALWSLYGARATFLAGGGFALLAALLLSAMVRRSQSSRGSP